MNSKDLNERAFGRSLQFKLLSPVLGAIAILGIFQYILLKSIVSANDPSTLKGIENLGLLAFLVVAGIATTISYLFSIRISQSWSRLVAVLAKEADDILITAKEITKSTTRLSEISSIQASSIQGTAASIDEVSSMVKKSADNASESHRLSIASRSAAEQGQKSVEKMIQAINEISQSNSDIMNQVENGNQQISEIVKVISEIGNKTKVINDIVFQTKLLSFNASVEAARAGEHGKGFSVVAEEVGNLAQMSGNAAKEISSMLEGSIQKVEGIVSDTKTKVERLVIDGKAKVEMGTQLATQCGEELKNILTTVEQVDGMINEIASASQEQSQGVTEINKAINQLDQGTQGNSTAALSTAKSAEHLESGANQIRELVSALVAITGRDDTSSRILNEPSRTLETKSSQKVPLSRHVIPLKPIRKVSETSGIGEAAPLKLAVGGKKSATSANPVPSKDDPRFEDV